MSLYSDNAATAIQNHSDYFGESISFRPHKDAAWQTISKAVPHRERVEKRKHSHGWVRVAVRSVFCNNADITNKKLLAEVKIGDVIYTVDEITNAAAGRVELHLVRFNPLEVTRPKYRG